MLVNLLLTHAQVYNTYLKQFIPGVIAIKNDRIFYAGPALKEGITAERVESVDGKYIIPGLIDSHMHIQSSMMVPGTFSDAVLPHGVTTVISEPHEIANVFGLEGIKESVKASDNCLLDIFLAMPSSVPSTSQDLETTGGDIDVPELKEMMTWPKTICLGEVMNVHDVIYKPDAKINKLVQYVMKEKPTWPIEGHCPRVVDSELATFLYRGITSDHTEQHVESMKQRILQGMFIQLQKKSLAVDILKYIDENHLEDRMAFVTDDTMPDTLWKEGHLDQILRIAISMGYPVEKAIYNATYTPACRMRLFDRGALDPGKLADLVVLSDLEHFTIDKVYKKGNLIASTTSPKYTYPEKFYHSVRVDPLCSKNFQIPAPIEEGTILCQGARIQEHSTMTESCQLELPVKNGFIDWEHTPYGLACVIERHGKNQHKGFLFVDGPIMKEGAAASTYAHDHHNLLVLGQNPKDMAACANEIISKQGGMATAKEGTITSFVSLPIAGILSDSPIEILSTEVSQFVKEMHNMGYTHDNIIMSMTTLGLPVSPAVKITDNGIIDVKEQKLIPLIISSSK